MAHVQVQEATNWELKKGRRSRRSPRNLIRLPYNPVPRSVRIIAYSNGSQTFAKRHCYAL